jgi:hypothetical protein
MACQPVRALAWRGVGRRLQSDHVGEFEEVKQGLVADPLDAIVTYFAAGTF